MHVGGLASYKVRFELLCSAWSNDILIRNITVDVDLTFWFCRLSADFPFRISFGVRYFFVFMEFRYSTFYLYHARWHFSWFFFINSFNLFDDKFVLFTYICNMSLLKIHAWPNRQSIQMLCYYTTVLGKHGKQVPIWKPIVGSYCIFLFVIFVLCLLFCIKSGHFSMVRIIVKHFHFESVYIFFISIN